MKFKPLAAALPLAILSSLTLANTLPAARYAEMMSMDMADTNKDGMVSREEFLEAAGKAFDMAAEKMKAKDGKMTSKQLHDFRNGLARGR